MENQSIWVEFCDKPTSFHNLHLKYFCNRRIQSKSLKRNKEGNTESGSGSTHFHLLVMKELSYKKLCE